MQWDILQGVWGFVRYTGLGAVGLSGFAKWVVIAGKNIACLNSPLESIDALLASAALGFGRGNAYVMNHGPTCVRLETA